MMDVGWKKLAAMPMPSAKADAPLPARVDTTGFGRSEATRIRCPLNSDM